MTLASWHDSIYRSTFMSNICGSVRTTHYDEALDWTLQPVFPEACIISGDNCVTVYQPHSFLCAWPLCYESVFLPYAENQGAAQAMNFASSRYMTAAESDPTYSSEDYSPYGRSSFPNGAFGSISTAYTVATGDIGSLRKTFSSHSRRVSFPDNELSSTSRSSSENSTALRSGEQSQKREELSDSLNKSSSIPSPMSTMPYYEDNIPISLTGGNSTKLSRTSEKRDSCSLGKRLSRLNYCSDAIQEKVSFALSHRRNPVSVKEESFGSRKVKTLTSGVSSGAQIGLRSPAKSTSSSRSRRAITNRSLAEQMSTISSAHSFSSELSSPARTDAEDAYHRSLKHGSSVRRRSVAVGNEELKYSTGEESALFDGSTLSQLSTLEQREALSVINTALEGRSQRSLADVKHYLRSRRPSRLELEALSVLESAVLGKRQLESRSPTKKFSSNGQDTVTLVTSILSEVMRSICEEGGSSSHRRSPWRPSAEQHRKLKMMATAIRKNLESVCEESDTDSPGALSAEEPQASEMATTVNEILRSMSEESDGDESRHSRGRFRLGTHGTVSTIASALTNIMETPKKDDRGCYNSKRSPTCRAIDRRPSTLNSSPLVDILTSASEEHLPDFDCTSKRPTRQTTLSVRSTIRSSAISEVLKSTSDDFMCDCDYPSSELWRASINLSNVTMSKRPTIPSINFKSTSEENVTDGDCSSKRLTLPRMTSQTSVRSGTLKSTSEDNIPEVDFPSRLRRTVETRPCTTENMRSVEDVSQFQSTPKRTIRKGTCSEKPNIRTTKGGVIRRSEDDIQISSVDQSQRSSQIPLRQCSLAFGIRNSAPTRLTSEHRPMTHHFVNSARVNYRPLSSNIPPLSKRSTHGQPERFIGSTSKSTAQVSRSINFSQASQKSLSPSYTNCPTESLCREHRSPCEECRAHFPAQEHQFRGSRCPVEQQHFRNQRSATEERYRDSRCPTEEQCLRNTRGPPENQRFRGLRGPTEEKRCRGTRYPTDQQRLRGSRYPAEASYRNEGIAEERSGGQICTTEEKCMANRGPCTECSSNTCLIKDQCIKRNICEECRENSTCPEEDQCIESEGPCEECRMDSTCLVEKECIDDDGPCEECPTDSSCPAAKVCMEDDGPCEECRLYSSCQMEKECIANSGPCMECPMENSCEVEKECIDEEGPCLECPIESSCQLADRCIKHGGPCEECPRDTSCQVEDQCIVSEGPCEECPMESACESNRKCIIDDGPCEECPLDRRCSTEKQCIEEEGPCIECPLEATGRGEGKLVEDTCLSGDCVEDSSFSALDQGTENEESPEEIQCTCNTQQKSYVVRMYEVPERPTVLPRHTQPRSPASRTIQQRAPSPRPQSSRTAPQRSPPPRTQPSPPPQSTTPSSPLTCIPSTCPITSRVQHRAPSPSQPSSSQQSPSQPSLPPPCPPPPCPSQPCPPQPCAPPPCSPAPPCPSSTSSPTCDQQTCPAEPTVNVPEPILSQTDSDVPCTCDCVCEGTVARGPCALTSTKKRLLPSASNSSYLPGNNIRSSPLKPANTGSTVYSVTGVTQSPGIDTSSRKMSRMARDRLRNAESNKITKKKNGNENVENTTKVNNLPKPVSSNVLQETKREHSRTSHSAHTTKWTKPNSPQTYTSNSVPNKRSKSLRVPPHSVESSGSAKGSRISERDSSSELKSIQPGGSRSRIPDVQHPCIKPKSGNNYVGRCLTDFSRKGFMVSRRGSHETTLSQKSSRQSSRSPMDSMHASSIDQRSSSSPVDFSYKESQRTVRPQVSPPVADEHSRQGNRTWNGQNDYKRSLSQPDEIRGNASSNVHVKLSDSQNGKIAASPRTSQAGNFKLNSRISSHGKTRDTHLLSRRTGQMFNRIPSQVNNQVSQKDSELVSPRASGRVSQRLSQRSRNYSPTTRQRSSLGRLRGSQRSNILDQKSSQFRQVCEKDSQLSSVPTSHVSSSRASLPSICGSQGSQYALGSLAESTRENQRTRQDNRHLFLGSKDSTKIGNRFAQKSLSSSQNPSPSRSIIKSPKQSSPRASSRTGRRALVDSLSNARDVNDYHPKLDPALFSGVGEAPSSRAPSLSRECTAMAMIVSDDSDYSGTPLSMTESDAKKCSVRKSGSSYTSYRSTTAGRSRGNKESRASELYSSETPFAEDSWLGNESSKSRAESLHPSLGSVQRSSSVPVRAATAAERQAISILAAAITNSDQGQTYHASANASSSPPSMGSNVNYPRAQPPGLSCTTPTTSTLNSWGVDDCACPSSSTSQMLPWNSSLKAQSAFLAAEAATAKASGLLTTNTPYTPSWPATDTPRFYSNDCCCGQCSFRENSNDLGRVVNAQTKESFTSRRSGLTGNGPPYDTMLDFQLETHHRLSTGHVSPRTACSCPCPCETYQCKCNWPNGRGEGGYPTRSRSCSCNRRVGTPYKGSWHGPTPWGPAVPDNMWNAWAEQPAGDSNSATMPMAEVGQRCRCPTATPPFSKTNFRSSCSCNKSVAGPFRNPWNGPTSWGAGADTWNAWAEPTSISANHQSSMPMADASQRCRCMSPTTPYSRQNLNPWNGPTSWGAGSDMWNAWADPTSMGGAHQSPVPIADPAQRCRCVSSAPPYPRTNL